MSPTMLQMAINDLKGDLDNKDAPFGVDLALPQLGGSARKTNVRHVALIIHTTPLNILFFSQYDYTKGQLPKLIDVVIENKAKLFVCAIGIPPKDMVDKLHAAGIVVMKSVTSLVYE
jgi:NAD(P)H-dependent flavin oxidoreductase YrpB (nitropropane dioxygenase family)